MPIAIKRTRLDEIRESFERQLTQWGIEDIAALLETFKQRDELLDRLLNVVDDPNTFTAHKYATDLAEEWRELRTKLVSGRKGSHERDKKSQH